jgi:hypothetical protein
VGAFPSCYFHGPTVPASGRANADHYRCSALFAELKLIFQVHGFTARNGDSTTPIVSLWYFTEMVESSESWILTGVSFL